MHGGDIYNNKIEYDFSVNVNPFAPYENVTSAIKNAISRLSEYPEYNSYSLKKKIADLHAITPSQICVTNGASEAINAVVKSPLIGDVIIEIPSFFGYEYSVRADQNVYAYSRNSMLKLNENIIKKNSLLIFANPANPTGSFTDIFKLDPLYKRVKEAEAYMLVDESFLPLCDYNEQSFIKKIKDNSEYYNRLIVVRSFTKSFSIPAIRLGYIISGEESLVASIERSLPEWNVSLLAQIAGEKCIASYSRIHDDQNRIRALRKALVGELNKIGAFCYDSCANYILFTAKKGLYEKLLEKKILIRDCSDYRGIEEIKKEIICRNINGDLGSRSNMGIYRVAVKSKEENELLLEAIKESLRD